MMIGEKIRQQRKQKKMSQEELAKKIGVKHSVISKYENNQIIPKFDTLKNLADALNISVSSLVDIDETDEISKDLFSPSNNLMDKINSIIDDFSHQIKHYEKIGDADKVSQLKKDFDFLTTKKGQIEAYRDLVILKGSVDDAARELAIREISFYLSKLNQAGIEEATKRVSELTRLEEYRKAEEKTADPLTIDSLLGIQPPLPDNEPTDDDNLTSVT